MFFISLNKTSIMKKVFLLFLLITMVGCGVNTATVDYDKTVNFSKYNTFNFYKKMHTGFSELDTKRVISAVKKELIKKGYTESDTPDFLVNIKSTKRNKPSRTHVNVGIGGGGRHLGGGINVGIPVGQDKLDVRVEFDMVDTMNSSLLWQGVHKATINRNESAQVRENKINVFVEQVFSQMPSK